MIALSMNRTDYENDIRSLLMAFFYGEKIVLNGEEWNVCLDVRYTENHTVLVLKDHNGRSLEKEGDCHFEDYRLGRNDIKKGIQYHENFEKIVLCMFSRYYDCFIVFCRNIRGWCCHGGH